MRYPDRLLAADGAYVSAARLPQLPKRGFIEMAPDFLIEVRSPEHSWESVIEKCGLWIAHGAGCVWAIDPLTCTVAEFRPGERPVVHRELDRKASAAPALPDFQISLQSMFIDL